MVNKSEWVMRWYEKHPPHDYQLCLNEMNAFYFHSDFFIPLLPPTIMDFSAVAILKSINGAERN